MRLRTIRYLKAFGLFEQRKYDDSMDLFSSVSATPRSVIALFPSIVSGDLAVQEESEEQDNRSETAEASSIKSTESPRILKALPEGVRASLDSPRRLKDTESDTGSIISKHTEIAPSGPPGTSIQIQGLTSRRERFNTGDVSIGSISSRHAFQIISMAKCRGHQRR